jgi:glycosyltransferase involved in cell wall biosynthesis
MTSRSVAVVIHCFNQGGFLKEALDSVFAQTIRPAEVVVVDDGSTDNTAAVASTYAGVNPVRQPNRGMAHARNRGLAQTSSEHVVFLDADDRLLPDALEIGLAELERRPDCALVFGRCERIDVSGRRLPTVAPPPLAEEAFTALLRGNLIWTPAVAMFRRSRCGSALRFDPSLGPGADYELYLRLAKQRRVEGHGRLVAEYRLHDASMSQDPARMLQSTVTVLRAQRPYVKSSPSRRAAYEYGLRSFKHYYGGQVVTQLRQEWRSPHRWSALVRGVMALLRYHPGGVFRQSIRYVHQFAGRLRDVIRLRAGARTRSA